MWVPPQTLTLSGLWVRIVSCSRRIMGFPDQVTWGIGDTMYGRISAGRLSYTVGGGKSICEQELVAS